MSRSSWPNRGHRIKHLVLHDEKPDVVPNPDPRGLPKLIMSLSEDEFKRITQLLSATPNLTPNEVRNMLLDEEKKRGGAAKGRKAPSEENGTQGRAEKLAGGGEVKAKPCNNCGKAGHRDDRCRLLHPDLSNQPPCSTCKKTGHGNDQCRKSHPERAPVWYRVWPLKQHNADTKGKGKEKAKASFLSKMVEQG